MRKGLLTCAALIGTADAYTLGGASVRRTSAVSMMADRKAPDVTDWSSVDPNDFVKLEPSWNDPREGEPFGDGDRGADGYRKKVGGVRVAEEAYQPRGISDATVIKPMYIETEDEPWHATCRPSGALPTKGDLEQGMANMLPFVKPELDLEEALRNAKDGPEVEAAVAKFVAAGAREGSPATESAKKMLAAWAKEDEKGFTKGKPKAPGKPKAQGEGWDNFARTVGKTHDNSVS